MRVWVAYHSNPAIPIENTSDLERVKQGEGEGRKEGCFVKSTTIKLKDYKRQERVERKNPPSLCCPGCAHSKLRSHV